MTSTTNKARHLLLMGLLCAFVTVSWVGQADTIYFSGETSDETPAELLNARLEYSYDAATYQLTISLFNETVEPDGYTLSELMFNTSDAVTSMTLLSNHLEDDLGVNAGSFSSPSLGIGSAQGGFGEFDWDLDFDTSGNDGILPEYSGHFVMSVMPNDGSLDMSDFFSHVSIRGRTETGEAVLHFTRGEDDDSAWAIPGDTPIVPEPASMFLVAMGLAGAALRCYRRRS